MRRLNKAYKYRIYPTKEQEIYFAKTFGCTRFIHNQMLADKIKHYEQTGEMLKNTPAQYKEVYPWLKEVDSLALSNAQVNLNTAYRNFFRDKGVGFPKFKSKRNPVQSYTTNNQKNTIRLIDSKSIRLPKIGNIKIKLHRQIPPKATIKSTTISKTATGKYYISILVEYEKVITPVLPKKEKTLGLDYSSKTLFVTNEGINADYPRFYRQAEEKLKKEQRKLSKMKKGSKNRSKQRIKVAKLHEKVANSRSDFLHKLSRQIANAYDAVIVEDINMRNIARGLNLAKSTNDNGFGIFRNFLSYKLAEEGKQLVKVDKWFPSSKLCRHCGTKNTELTLADREWFCSCGKVIDRDINAAINIKNEGCRILGIA